VDAGEANEGPDLCQPEQVGNYGLTAPVLVRAARVQSVATASGFLIDQRGREIVAAEKPLERPHGVGFPLEIAIRAPRRKTGRDTRGRLERLLIERPRKLASVTETLGADRPEKSVFRRLQRHDPAQGSQAGGHVGGVAEAGSRNDQGLR
jgi:hypothetical protein